MVIFPPTIEKVLSILNQTITSQLDSSRFEKVELSDGYVGVAGVMNRKSLSGQERAFSTCYELQRHVFTVGPQWKRSQR